MEQSSLRARHPVPGMRRWVLVLLSAFMVLNYAEETTLSVSAPFIMRSLSIDLASFGTVLSIFYLGYAPFAFIGGWASDKWGILIVFVIAAAWWSISGFFAPAATGFLVQRAGSWTLVFSVAGCLSVIGAMLPFEMGRARMQAAIVS